MESKAAGFNKQVLVPPTPAFPWSLAKVFLLTSSAILLTLTFLTFVYVFKHSQKQFLSLLQQQLGKRQLNKNFCFLNLSLCYLKIRC